MNTEVTLGRGFYFCHGSLDPNDSITQNQSDSTQFLYVISGSVEVNGQVLTTGWHDQTSIFKNGSNTYTAGSEGLSYVAINPAYSYDFSAQVLTGEQTIVGTDKFKVLCDLKGTFTANNITFNDLNFSVIEENKVVELSVSDGTICVLLTKTN